MITLPDNIIGKVAAEIEPQLPSGTMLLVLDAAPPYADVMPKNRPDLTYFVGHPCHPPICNEETGDARKDYHGGVVQQSIVCALMQGPEEHDKLCEAVARAIYRPVERAHLRTVEQLAILEPALSETVAATIVMELKEATDEAVRRRVPEQAAVDFMLGHLNIELAIAFKIFPRGKFSDGALATIDAARPVLFRQGLLNIVFDLEMVRKSVRAIAAGD